MDDYFTPASTQSTEALHTALEALDPTQVQSALKAGASTARKLGTSELNAVHRLLWLDPSTIKADPGRLLLHTQCFRLLLEAGGVRMVSKTAKKYNVYEALDGRWEGCALLWMAKMGSRKAAEAVAATGRRTLLQMSWWEPLLERARAEERLAGLDRKLPSAPSPVTKPRM